MAALAEGSTSPDARPGAHGPVDGWRWYRVGLLVGWALLVAGAAAVGQHPGHLGQLRGALGAGEVDVVHVSGGSQGGSGYARQEVRWRQGWVQRRVEVLQVSTDTEVPPDAADDVQRVAATDVGADLRRDFPAVRVVRSPELGSYGEVLGWRVPEWTGLVMAGLGMGTLGLLISGPLPWRATRWAWFWLALVGPVGSMAFLLLSGPVLVRPRVLLAAPRPGRRRLTGGWAFLLAGVLGAFTN